jgi:glutathione S-transferase
MILIGQYDSPFVRRVGIALALYGMGHEHRPWSVFGDGERIAHYNPLRRVPTLVLDDGEVVIESAAILDHLDDVAGPDRALIARTGPARRQALKVCALATGLCDKAVSLIYERVLHQETSEVWVGRCRAQIGAALAMLEADRAGRASDWWFGEAIGHADIAVGCALRFLGDAHPALFAAADFPALAEHAARCEALAPFRSVAQRFIPPA